MKQTPIEIPKLHNLYRVTPDDFEKGSTVLGKAFREDPIWSRLLEGQHHKFRTVFGLSLKYTLKYGHVYAPTSDLEGLAAWLASPYTNITFWRLIKSGAIIPVVRLGGRIIQKVSKAFDRVEKHRKTFMKKPFLYLFALGVHPENQGHGIGSKLVKYMLDKLHSGIPVYLETETEDNIRFYQKFGFELEKSIHVPFFNLPMHIMVYNNQ